jgi:hypothetical protein
MDHERAGEEQVITETEAPGFNLVERLDFLHSQIFFRFRKY